MAPSITSRTIVDLKVSLCKMSKTTSINLVYASAVASEQPNRTEFDATQSLNHIHHVTEVVAADIEGSEMSIAEIAVIQEDEQFPSVAEELPVTPPRRKCTSWYCPHGKNPFQVASLILLYLVLGVIFFPFLLVVFMVCCVSFFTPDID